MASRGTFRPPREAIGLHARRTRCIVDFGELGGWNLASRRRQRLKMNVAACLDHDLHTLSILAMECSRLRL